MFFLSDLFFKVLLPLLSLVLLMPKTQLLVTQPAKQKPKQTAFQQALFS